MPLTEQERAWLERRKNLCARCQESHYDNPCIRYGRRGESGECPGFSYRIVEGLDERDVEFEARVAARLSELVNAEPWPNLWPECVSCGRHAKEGDAACPTCVMKETRLAVEAEMDGGANG